MFQTMEMSHAESSIPKLGAQQAVIVEDRLRKSPYLPLRSLKCSYYQGKLLLSGQVATFYLKQLAQSLARSAGEIEVVNCVEVAGPGNMFNRRSR